VVVTDIYDGGGSAATQFAASYFDWHRGSSTLKARAQAALPS